MQNACSELETELDPVPAMGRSKCNFKEDDLGRQGWGGVARNNRFYLCPESCVYVSEGQRKEKSRSGQRSDKTAMQALNGLS